MRFIAMSTTLNPDEAGEPPPELFGEIMKLGAEAVRIGAMTETGGMGLTGTVKLVDGEILTDGPYTEAKELFGGYAVYDVADEAQIIKYTQQFLDVHRRVWPSWEGQVIIYKLVAPPMMPG